MQYVVDVDLEEFLEEAIVNEGMYDVVEKLLCAFENCWEVEGYDAITANKVLKRLSKVRKELSW